MLRREEGQTMAEYGLVLAIIAIVTVAAYVALGDSIAKTIQRVISVL